MSAARTLRRLAAPAAAVLLTLALTGCGDDGDDGDTAGAASDPTSQSADEDTPTDEASSEAPATDAGLDPALVDEVVTAYLSEDPECPDGGFEEVDDLLTTLSEKYIREATSLQSYYCGGLIDQAVLAEYPDAETAAGLLDDEETGFFSKTFVAGSTALAINTRVITEGGVDVVALFDELAAECGCGETLYEGE